jgi:methylated-DNA-protein-cysteine methyltransferase-like protein
MRPEASGAAPSVAEPLATGTHARIYAAVRQIPNGRVTTYGTVARIAGLPGQARLVGYALSALKPGSTVPWHRVINAQGTISVTEESGARTTQALRLHREGVLVSAGGRISLAKFGWRMSR